MLARRSQTVGCLTEKIPIDEHVSMLVADPSLFESDDDLSPARRLFEIVSKFTRFYSSILTRKVPDVVQAVSDYYEYGRRSIYVAKYFTINLGAHNNKRY